MTKAEKQAIFAAAQRIFELASLENCSFDPFHPEHDAQIKKIVRPYMVWFECVAEGLEKVAKADRPEEKQYALHYLQDMI